MTSSIPPSGAEMARLQRRTQAVARLRHPNLVRMLPLPGGAGLAPLVGDTRRLADFTLPAGTFKRFDLEQVVRLLLDVLSGLAALHEVVTDGQGFVHGEASPQHVFVDEHGTARLVPLLSSHFTGSRRTEQAGYLAPERLTGGASDARADVFSVGVMLWEALSGKRLFPDASLSAVRARLHQSLEIELAPRDSWAAPLCAIARRAIAFDPALRFRSALELSHAIATAAAQQLSRVDADAWQEEAPTPVFQPRLHLPALRASLPPPPLGPAHGLQTAPPTANADAPIDAVPIRSRWRAAWWGLGAAAVAALAIGVQRAPNSWRGLVGGAFEAAPYLRAAASPPVPAPVAPVPAPVAPTTAQAVPTPSLAPQSAATAGSAPPIRSSQPTLARSARPIRVNARVKPLTTDYGI
jgi:serine/threonine protein kinase